MLVFKKEYYKCLLLIQIDPSWLDIDKISFKSTDNVIYHIEYITTIMSLDNEKIDSANSLHLNFNNADGYIECNSTECSSTEEINEDKYLIFASTDKNKEVLKRGSKPIKYEKGFMKIRFESNDDLPLGEILGIPVCIIVAGPVFQKGNNYYPQAHLHECLYGFINEL